MWTKKEGRNGLIRGIYYFFNSFTNTMILFYQMYLWWKHLLHGRTWHKLAFVATDFQKFQTIKAEVAAIGHIISVYDFITLFMPLTSDSRALDYAIRLSDCDFNLYRLLYSINLFLSFDYSLSFGSQKHWRKY